MATKTFTAKTKGEWVQLSTLINFDFVDGKDYTLQVLGTAKFGDDGKTGILIDSTAPYTYTHKSGVDLYVMTENEDGAVITVSDSASLSLATRGGGSGGGSGDAVWGSITGTLSNQTDLQTALNDKQDTLTAGSNISISSNVISATYSAFTGTDGVDAGTTGLVPAPTVADANKYLKSDGTWATVSGGGSVSYDNATINENASNQLQAIGIVDKNGNNNDQKLGFWCGTQSEWNTGAFVQFYDWTRQGEGFNVTERPWFTGQAIINTGTYYIAACYNHISISSAGTSWNSVYQYESGDTNGTEALAYDGNNTVVMVGNTVGAVSIDGGENWGEDYNWGGKIDITCVTINNTPTFLAVDESGGLYSSTDGTTITVVNTLDWDVIQPETAGGNPHVIAIHSYNGTVRILTKQGKVAVSTDGLATWTAEQIGTYTTDYPNLWVKLSCFEATDTWVALKADGTVYYNSGSGWVLGDDSYSMVNPSNGVTYKSIGYDSATNNEKMIALASDGSLKSTTNGTGWAVMTKLAQLNEHPWMAICSNGSGGFCAVTVYGTALWGTVTEHVYTRNARPDMWEVTYSAPNTSSGYNDWEHRVQTYDSANNQITLSNGNVYTYDSPVNGTGSIGEVYPNYISYITDTQEIRKGYTTIANGQTVTVDQNYGSWSMNAQSGIAVSQAIANKQDTLTAGSNILISSNVISATYSAFTGATGNYDGTTGLVPAPTATDDYKFLKGDGTWSTASSVSGTFTTNDGKTITITNGIVTSIV